jgi:transcriptional regulator with XRE-family HTH domain
MFFGTFIRNLRLDRGITLRDFAKRLGVSATYVSQVEQGKCPIPTEERIVRMAQLLGQDPDELLAEAGRVADDLPAIICRQPRELAGFLRTVQGLAPDAIAQLAEQAQQLKQQQQEPTP